jgi:ATP-dependent Clp protease ATP-binding subunit ClpA
MTSPKKPPKDTVAATGASLPADPADLADNTADGDRPPGPALARLARRVHASATESAGRSCVRPELAEAIARVCTRGMTNCPVLWGEPGCGRGRLMLAATHMLLHRGCVRSVWTVSGATLCAGNLHWQETDAVLMRLLADAAMARRAMFLFRDMDLAVTGSPASHGMLADAIDAGVRFIATARYENAIERFQMDAAIARRLVPVRVDPPTAAQVRRTLIDAATAHRVTVEPAAIDTAIHLAAHRPGWPNNEPAASLAVLDAAIADARWRDPECRRIVPDDLYAADKFHWPQASKPHKP